MINLRRLSFGALTVALLFPAASSADALCELPVTAYVTDAAGAPLDGEADVELRFYAAPVGEAPLECRSFEAATIDDGWLRLTLDACGAPAVADCGVAPLRDVIAATTELFVGVVVGDGDELMPRFSVGAVPFALSAHDAQHLGGEPPAAFEDAGTAEGLLGDHTANADAHHPADSSGLRIEPDAATVGEVHIEGDAIDFGPDVDDVLSADMVRTLTGGGDADALHVHAAGMPAGGACYVAWGPTTCIEGYTLVYDGIAVGSWMADHGGANVSQADTICIDSTVVSSYVSDIPGIDAQGLGTLRDGQERALLTTGRLSCAFCCR